MDKLNLQAKAKTFLATDEHTIARVAEKVGITLPSNNVALFQSVYAPLEESNLNGVRLASDAVYKALNTLIGAQANLNHSAEGAPYGAGFIVGVILDSWVDEATKEINIIFSFAKNVYQEDYIRAVEMQKEGTLSVSFELMTERNAQEDMGDGTVKLHDIEFTGVGLLLDASPAYPKAKVYEMAKTYKTRANSTPELMYASVITESCDKILTEMQTLEEGSESMEQKEVKEAQKIECGKCHNIMNIPEDKTPEDMVCSTCGNPMKYKEEAKDEAIVTETSGTSSTSETISVEIKEEPKVAEKIEEAKQVTTIENQTLTTIVDEPNANQETTISITTITRNWEEEATTALTKVAELEITLTQKEEELKTIKAELEIFKAEKEAQVKAEAEAQAADEKADKDAKLAAIKEELKDNPYTKDFTDEDYFDTTKVSNAKILKERDDLKAEVETLRAKDKVVEKQEFTAAKKSDDLDTGHKETTVKANPRDTLRKLGRK